MAIVGFYIHAQDSKSRMFNDDSTLAKCTTCGFRLDFFAHNPNHVLSQQKFDLVATYDGQTIVSLAFKEFCLQQQYKGLHFLEFDHDIHHFHLIIDTIIPFDVKRRKTRFGPLCETCGNFQYVAGATPSYLKIRDPLANGIYRSDVLFGDGNEKHPLRFAGEETREKMLAEGLKIVFSPAEGI